MVPPINTPIRFSGHARSMTPGSNPYSPTVVRSEVPRNLPPGIQNLVKNLQTLNSKARPKDIQTILDASFTDDFMWDGQVIQMTGKGWIGPVWTALAGFFQIFLSPQIVRIIASGHVVTHLEIVWQLRYHLHRRAILPLSYLIPDLDLHCTYIVSMRNNKICGLQSYYHNLPSLPRFFRTALGWGVGLSARVMEPFASRLLDGWILKESMNGKDAVVDVTKGRTLKPVSNKSEVK